MKIYGIIDIGSNSVRAKAFSDGKILYSGLVTTRLGEGIVENNRLTERSIRATVKTVTVFCGELIRSGATDILAFATEAVRSADNGEKFCAILASETGVTVDVVSGSEEGELALLGAVESGDGGVIDIGGASAEISVVAKRRVIYSHSLPLGAVRLYSKCGDDETKLREVVDERIREYGELPVGVKYYAVGGTATTLAALDMRLDEYDERKVDGYILTRKSLEKDYGLIVASDYNERVNKLHISAKRADVIGCGAYLLLRIMRDFGIDEITIRESDNLLGYLKKRVYGESYERA